MAINHLEKLILTQNIREDVKDIQEILGRPRDSRLTLNPATHDFSRKVIKDLKEYIIGEVSDEHHFYIGASINPTKYSFPLYINYDDIYATANVRTDIIQSKLTISPKVIGSYEEYVKDEFFKAMFAFKMPSFKEFWLEGPYQENHHVLQN